MAKKTVLDYKNPETLVGREVIVGLQGGTNIPGEIRFLDADTLVLILEPKSTLDIETRVVHTVIKVSRIEFIQFKTDRQ